MHETPAPAPAASTELADLIGALVDGFDEQIRYGLRIHDAPAPRVVRRTETRRQAPLLAQLAAHPAPRRAAGPRPSGAPPAGSRPPMSLDAAALIDRIATVATDAHRVLSYYAPGPAPAGRTVAGRLRALVPLAAAVEPVQPSVVRGVARLVRQVVRDARVLLDYEPRPRVLTGWCCAECGGRLALDPEQLRTWCIGLGTVEGPARVGEISPVRYGSCGSSYSRSAWLSHIAGEAS
ncbi:hypothetical protein GCM10027294_43630 [Marinactinospora endophytica]